jgi:hypothetical protein
VTRAGAVVAGDLPIGQITLGLARLKTDIGLRQLADPAHLMHGSKPIVTIPIREVTIASPSVFPRALPVVPPRPSGRARQANRFRCDIRDQATSAPSFRVERAATAVVTNPIASTCFTSRIPAFGTEFWRSPRNLGAAPIR